MSDNQLSNDNNSMMHSHNGAITIVGRSGSHRRDGCLFSDCHLLQFIVRLPMWLSHKLHAHNSIEIQLCWPSFAWSINESFHCFDERELSQGAQMRWLTLCFAMKFTDSRLPFCESHRHLAKVISNTHFSNCSKSPPQLRHNGQNEGERETIDPAVWRCGRISLRSNDWTVDGFMRVDFGKDSKIARYQNG